MKMRSIVCGLSLLLPVLLMLPEMASALPRYSARSGQSCHLCHVAPAGGGMRTEYGAQFFAGTELARQRLDLGALKMLDSRVSDRVRVGFDFRGMYLQELQDGEPRTGLPKHEAATFFQMQGDIYLQLQLDPRVTVVFEKGLRQSYEAWAQAHVLPWHGSVKLGHFQPFFGWKQVDHETFTRQYTGFGRSDNDTGVEIELHPDQWSLSAALTNDGSGMLDGDRGKALTLRVAWQGEWLGQTLALGMNGRLSDRAPAPSRRIAGLFAAWSLGELAWLGEVDQVEEGGRSGLAFSQELSWRLVQGFEALYAYDFWDPDTDEAGGFDTRHRLALDYIPWPFLAIQPGLALRRHERIGAADEWFIADLQFHLFM
jgi:hypothetical protein